MVQFDVNFCMNYKGEMREVTALRFEIRCDLLIKTVWTSSEPQ